MQYLNSAIFRFDVSGIHTIYLVGQMDEYALFELVRYEQSRHLMGLFSHGVGSLVLANCDKATRSSLRLVSKTMCGAVDGCAQRASSYFCIGQQGDDALHSLP